jgi:phage/plasmid primase-like uncharacterized protein
MTTALYASDLAHRFNLYRVAGRQEWRGDCPLCGYTAAFVLTVREGRPLLWCASCQDRTAITGLLRGAELLLPATPVADVEKSERKRETALRLWNGSEPAVGTLADRYLTARALPGLAASLSLRFRADCPHPAGSRLPAMVALVTNVDGTPVAAHRTFIARDGSGKGIAEPRKASLGPVWGGAVRLDPVAPELVIAEGLETAASAGRLLGLSAWSAVSAGNLARGLVLPAEVKSVVIAADADEAGERASREAALRWQREGRWVRIARPDVAGQDFNDLLRIRAEMS